MRSECKRCHGTGYAPPPVVSCPNCRGMGEVEADPLDELAMARMCEEGCPHDGDEVND